MITAKLSDGQFVLVQFDNSREEGYLWYDGEIRTVNSEKLLDFFHYPKNEDASRFGSSVLYCLNFFQTQGQYGRKT